MIIELKKDQFGLVADLYKDIDHNRGVIEAVLQGPFPARVFVDDVEKPNMAVVYPVGFFYFVAGRQFRADFLKAFGRMLFEDWQVNIVELFFFPEDWSEHANLILGDRPRLRFERRDYALNHELFQERKAELLGKLPEGMELLPIDHELLSQYNVNTGMWLTREDYLQQGFGYCLVVEHGIATQCVVGLRTATEVELDVRTDEQYRKQGLATLVSAATIDHALRSGLEPTWSCFSFNQGSWKIAEKLGFELKHTKSIVLWDTSLK